MYLKSKIELTHNDGVATTANSIIVARLLGFERDGDCTKVLASYDYSKVGLNEEGQTIATPIIRDKILIEGEALNALHNAVRPDIPNTDDEPLRERTKMYLAFRLRMVETFKGLNPDLTVGDIEIINE